MRVLLRVRECARVTVCVFTCSRDINKDRMSKNPPERKKDQYRTVEHGGTKMVEEAKVRKLFIRSTGVHMNYSM